MTTTRTALCALLLLSTLAHADILVRTTCRCDAFHRPRSLRAVATVIRGVDFVNLGCVCTSNSPETTGCVCPGHDARWGTLVACLAVAGAPCVASYAHGAVSFPASGEGK